MKTIFVAVLLAAIALLAPTVHARQEMLLDVSHGQQPTDIGSDKKICSLVESKELGGQALKVEFPTEDSFGDRVAKVKDWKPFTHLRFAAFNPSTAKVELVLTVKHQYTTGYANRVDVPIVLAPGRNDIQLPIAEMENTNHTPPDLANVRRWYIASPFALSAPLYFGDFYLEGFDTPPATTAQAAAPEPLAPVSAEPQGEAPAIATAVMFNTPEADAILSKLPVFPPNNPWNADISAWPLHPNSAAMIASIGADKPFRYNDDMAFVIAAPGQKRVAVKIDGYPDESDPGPYPVPDNTPIEGWPTHFRDLTLDDAQRNVRGEDGDRHGIVVDATRRKLYEFYQLRKTKTGWVATQASIFDLASNKLRPRGWTSADAAGLPIFPAVVRYDELKNGVINHALRVTVRRSRRAFIEPATHFASRSDDPNLPRMGERIRLRQDFDVTGFSREVQVILNALKKHGMFVADNGIEWAISVAPDRRIPDLNDELRRIKGGNFEVVVAPR